MPLYDGILLKGPEYSYKVFQVVFSAKVAKEFT